MVKSLTIITGASRGIGLSVSKLLSSKNYPILAISRTSESIQELQNPNIIPLNIDLSHTNSIKKIANFIGRDYKVKNIIHSAGTWDQGQLLHQQSQESLENIMKINALAPLFINNALISQNKFVEGARILNIGTQAAHQPFQNLSMYSISKSALYMGFLCQKNELVDKGVFVGSVKPGVTKTQILKEIQEKGRVKIEGDILEPDLVAQFLHYLISDKISNAQFCKEEWDIYDRKHHKEWVPLRVEMPLKAPKFISL